MFQNYVILKCENFDEIIFQHGAPPHYSTIAGNNTSIKVIGRHASVNIPPWPLNITSTDFFLLGRH